MISNFKHISDKTISSPRHLLSTKTKLSLININQNNSLFSAIVKPIQETLPIYKKQ